MEFEFILRTVAMVCLGWLIYVATYGLLDSIYAIFRGFKKKPKQTCFVYCPRCRNELVSSNSFVEDRDGIVKYECSRCGIVSFWDFAHYPAPVLKTCAEDCKHSYIDKFGYCYCDYEDECDPDTMVKFEPMICVKEE